MWTDLPQEQKNEYKRLILTFARLTGMFAQKSTDDNDASPIINSKYQETAFQRAFCAYTEDIGNTSYDVSLQHNCEKYLVGIKTFSISSGYQKVAQFKSKHDEWEKIIDEIKRNAKGIDDKEEINIQNHNLYLGLAKMIARIRNARIDSSYANIRGFMIETNDNHVHSVYHVLMPSSYNDLPKIFVGETSYDKIDIEHINILGCTEKNNPTDFFFTDRKHTYKYTSTDSQLHMSFQNKNIVCEEWDVRYADDANAIFDKIADIVYSCEENIHKSEVDETYSWTIWNKNGETEMYSGFNSFFATGSKMSKNQRKQRIEKVIQEYEKIVEEKALYDIKSRLTEFLLEPAISASGRARKVRLREYIVRLAKESGDMNLSQDVLKILYRPMDEMYIPIPESAQFHKEHPNFFGVGFGETVPRTSKLALPKEERRFNLVFEPSGDKLPAYITQDYGKAIESAEKQTYLGEWILRGVFQLEEYEPLTTKKLLELNINGLRFTKYKGSDDIHIEFIWIDENNPPKGFIARK